LVEILVCLGLLEDGESSIGNMLMEVQLLVIEETVDEFGLDVPVILVEVVVFHLTLSHLQ
jgi:hypothetical protein